MPEYMLVAISHATSVHHDELMSPFSRQRFVEKVVPLIDQRTLIVCEGLDYDKVVSPADRRYPILLKHMAGNALGDRRPSFFGCDFRQTGSREKDAAILRKMEFWEKTARRLVIADRPPRLESLADVIELVKTGAPAAALAAAPTSGEVEVARWIGAISRKFDRLNIAAMRKHGRRFDRCMFVGGAIHVVAMAQKCDFNVFDCTESADAHSIYGGYLADYNFARLFLKAST